MSLRLRIYSAVLPLFLLLGTANALFYHWVTGAEVYWGLRERAQSAALTLAGFLPTLQDADAQRRALSRWSTALDGATAIAFRRGSDGTWSREVLHSFPDTQAADQPPEDVLAELQERAVAVRFVPRTDLRHDVFQVYAAIPIGAREVQEVVTVSGRDTSVRLHRARAWRTGLLELCLVMGLGWLVAELIIWLARGEIRALGALSSQIVSGHFRQRRIQGRIRELNDLGGTLQTMASVLGDSVEKTRRGLLRSDAFPAPAELAARVLRSQWPRTIEDRGSGYHLLLAGLGSAASWTDFHGLHRDARFTIGLVGRVQAQSGADELEHWLNASAARESLLALGPDLLSAEAVARVLRRFPCRRLELLQIDHDCQVVRATSFDAEAGWSEHSVQRGYVAGTVTPATLRLLGNYVHAYGAGGLARIGALLETLEQQDSGTVMLYAAASATMEAG